jgi:Uma2 family endonuclease
MNDVNRSTPATIATPSHPGEPTWEVAFFFPTQGDWTKEEYLALATNRLVELSDGRLELLPMPTDYHQVIVGLLYRLLYAFVSTHAPGGHVRFAPLPVRLWDGRFREPDVLFMKAEHVNRIQLYWDGADLVMEVVSTDPHDRKRDLETKRQEYARAKIPEYWIVDPQEQRITVLTLDGATYRVHGEFGPGMEATSVLLPGFVVKVEAVFASGAV